MMKQIISIGKYIDCRTITKYGKVFTCYTVEFYGGIRWALDFDKLYKITEQLLPERDLQYVLRHNADIIVESVDPDGNVFNLKSNGDYAVMAVNEDDLYGPPMYGFKMVIPVTPG
jgi:hypothetical protein